MRLILCGSGLVRTLTSPRLRIAARSRSQSARAVHAVLDHTPRGAAAIRCKSESAPRIAWIVRRGGLITLVPHPLYVHFSDISDVDSVNPLGVTVLA